MKIQSISWKVKIDGKEYGYSFPMDCGYSDKIISIGHELPLKMTEKQSFITDVKAIMQSLLETVELIASKKEKKK